jgi:hypothetical protein
VTDIDLSDSTEAPVRRKWYANYGIVKAIVVSRLNLPVAVKGMKKGGMTKRARDDHNNSDDMVEVLGVRKAAIKK